MSLTRRIVTAARALFPQSDTNTSGRTSTTSAVARLRFHELPPELRAQLIEADFLRACRSLRPPRLIVWSVIRAAEPRANRSHELEWDPARNYFVSLVERAADLPSERDVGLADPSLRARLTFELRGESQKLAETVSVHDAVSGAELVRASRHAYSPGRQEYADWIREELARVRFPSEYAKWTVEHQVAHWTRTLYRLRRSMGESGNDEDAALSPEVVEAWRAIDPHVDRLLPAIAYQLARMERVSEASILHKLQHRD